jgi:hypothetical protein
MEGKVRKLLSGFVFAPIREVFAEALDPNGIRPHAA